MVAPFGAGVEARPALMSMEELCEREVGRRRGKLERREERRGDKRGMGEEGKRERVEEGVRRWRRQCARVRGLRTVEEVEREKEEEGREGGLERLGR